MSNASQPHPIDRLHTAPGNCRSTDVEHLADPLVGAAALERRPGVDDDHLRVGRNRVCHLEIHHRLAARFAGLSTDEDRLQRGQPRQLGEVVEVLLVVATERVEHDGLSLAGKTGCRKGTRVVGRQQGVRRQPRPRNVERNRRRARLPVRGVPEDASEVADRVADRLRDLGLLRRTRRTPALARRGSRAPTRRTPWRGRVAHPRRWPSPHSAAIARRGLYSPPTATAARVGPCRAARR